MPANASPVPLLVMPNPITANLPLNNPHAPLSLWPARRKPNSRKIEFGFPNPNTPNLYVKAIHFVILFYRPLRT